MSGWISLHRKIQDHWLFPTTRQFTDFEAWIDILMEVNHDENKCNIGSQLYYIKAGESLKSLDTWSKRWNWNKSKTRRFLNLLQKDNMIELKNETKTTRLTVCNYDSYQKNGNANETQVKRKRNASETHLTPNNNDNNYNKLNKISFDVFWDLYDKKISKPKSEIKWNKLNAETQHEIIDYLPNYLKTISDKKYQPYPETFLNQQRWLDEITPQHNDKPMEIFVDGFMRKVAFYKENGSPVFEGTSKPTLEEVKSWK